MKPFVPNQLPIQDIDYRALISLVGRSNRSLAQYSGMLQAIVNPEVLLSPMTMEEAVLSSKIEGTQATAQEVFEQDAGAETSEEKRGDIREVVNYRRAMLLGQNHLESKQTLNLNLIRQLHEILMEGARYDTGKPGDFRKIQNWIGPPGTPQEDATYVPPAPLQLMDHLQDWENYIHIDDFDVLAQAAIVHAQFELIHPFGDGNGRIGRLLIPLFLFLKGALKAPMFYLSEYLEKNRDDYYLRLQRISQAGEWTDWIAFFLIAIEEQARKNTHKLRKVSDLYDRAKDLVRDTTHSQHSAQIVDFVFCRPIFTSTQLRKELGVSAVTVNTMLKGMEAAEMLRKLRPGSGRSPALFVYPEMLNIAEGKDIF